MIVDQGKFVFRLVGAIFGCVGLTFLAVGGWLGHRQYTIMKSWPTVEALVTKSRITYYHHRGHRVYETEIEFRYTVNGKTFDTPSDPGYSTSSYDTMKGFADSFARGTRHMIRYNPDDPSDVRMNAGYNFGFLFLPVLFGGLGLLFTGVSVVLFIAARWGQTLVCPACGLKAESGQRYCTNCNTPLPVPGNQSPASQAA